MVLFFSVTGEGKCEMTYKKKKIYFCLLGSLLPEEMRSRELFDYFW